MDTAFMVDLSTQPSSEEDTNHMDPKELQKQLAALQFEKAKEQLRADQAVNRITELEAEAVVLSAERDDARDKLEVAVDAAKTVETGRADALTASVGLRLKAISVLPVSDKGAARFDDMSDRDIKLAVVEHLSGKALDATKSDEYVAARFDSAVEAVPAQPNLIQRIDAVATPNTESSMREKQAANFRNLNPFYSN